MDDVSNATEEPHDFVDFNAKLLVLDALCYELDVLEPWPGAPHEDAEDEDEAVEGADALARDYYDDLDVLPSQLALVTELTVDASLEIYQDVHPDWDGADDRYDPATWDDVLALPELTTVWVSAPLPAHVDADLRARGVAVESQ